MIRKYLLFASIVLLISPVLAVSGEVVIDNFEDGSISDWSMLWGDETSDQQNVNLASFPHSGSYSILLWDSRDGPAVDFAKQNIGMTFNNPISYYNISFWYYAITPCDYPTNSIKHRIYLSDESTFLFKAVRIDSGDIMSCGQWNYISKSISDEYFELLGSFSLDSTSLGSMMIETWHNGVYYDDIKLIPKIPEEVEEDCEPEWVCGDWENCSSGIQTRSCVDVNNCGDDSTMPSEQQSCGAVVTVLEPEITTFLPGQTITIKVNVSYPNGTILDGLDLVLNAFNTGITMTETQPGIYSIMLVTDENDIGEWDVSFSGFDNLQFSEMTIDIRESTIGEGTSLFADFSSFISNVASSVVNIATSFWYVFVILIIIVIIIYIILKRPIKIKPKRKKERKEIKKEKPKKKKKKKPPKVKERFDDSDGLHEVKL